MGRPPLSLHSPPPAGLRPQQATAVRSGALGAAAAARPTAIGANGGRPLLAWAGVAARPPPRVDPASTQQSAEGGNQPRAAPAAEAPGVAAQRAAARPVVDEEGFTLVQRPPGGAAARQQAAADAQRPPGTEPRDGGDGQRGPAAPPRAVEESCPREDAAAVGHGQAEAAAEGGGEGAPPSVDALKEEWQQEQQLLDLLIQRGYDEEHPVRVAAQQQVEAAHRAWADASPGVAVTQRLLWADKALQRARRGHARLEQEIDELDRKYEYERGELCGKLHEQRARVRQREAKLAELSREAAGTFQAGGAHAEGRLDAIRGAVQTIEGDLAQAMREAHGLTQEGSPLRAKLEEAMGAIAAVHGMATHATRERSADHYHMSDVDDAEDWGHEGWSGDGDHWAHDRWPHEGAWSAWHDGGHGYTSGWSYPAWQPAARAHEDTMGADMDTGEVQAPVWMRVDGSGDAHWGGRSWKRGRREADDATGLQGRQLEGDSGPEALDHERVAIQQAQVQDAQAQHLRQEHQRQLQQEQGAGTTAPAPPTPRAEDLALEARRRAVWDQAQNDGVEVSAEELANMDAMVLEEWAAAHLI